MFPYDIQLSTAVQPPPQTIQGVLHTLQEIDSLCVEGDGLKWFNLIYFQVTQAVSNQVFAGGFHDPAWLSELDVQFAAFYFKALHAALTGAPCSGCWKAMFAVRNGTDIARIQFALAGMNAHINHDLAMAVVATSKSRKTVPRHGTPQYSDYTAINSTLDTLIESAKRTLNVRLLGEVLPAASHVEDTIAAWNLSVSREKAWNTAQSLWSVPPFAADGIMDVIDGLTTVVGKTLLVPAPRAAGELIAGNIEIG